MTNFFSVFLFNCFNNCAFQKDMRISKFSFVYMYINDYFMLTIAVKYVAF